MSDRTTRRAWRRRCLARTAGLVVLACLSVSASGVRTERIVQIPVTLDAAFLGRLLTEQVFREPGGIARIEAEDRCSELVLSQPRVALEAGRVQVFFQAKTGLGIGVGGGCWTLLVWEGEVEVHEEPVLDASLPGVRFRVVDSILHPRNPGLLRSDNLWEWIKPAVHPRLETWVVDLGPPLEELREVLPPFFRRADDAVLRRLVDSIAIESVRVESEHLVLGLHLAAPETAPPEIATEPEAPLSAEELAAFEATTRNWDAFLTFVVKQAGSDALSPEIRSALLDVLLDARAELVDSLAEPPARGEDPVRALFLATWNRLAPLLRGVDSGLPGESALRYVAFVAAGDVLAALDAAGSPFGLEISSDGLRRLARTLAPARPEDPLRFGGEVDPELRSVFGFGAPLPPPHPEPAQEETPDGTPEQPAAPDAAAPGEVAPSEPVPASEPSPTGASLRAPEPGMLGRWLVSLARVLEDLVAAPAHAAGEDPLEALVQRLRRWVPTRKDAHEYLPVARDLLEISARSVRASSALPETRADLFHDLVLATGWQESCWRQYVRDGKRLVPLRSRAGAVGFMQVSERVWRGFYEAEGLRWDVGYNVRAGAEILAHYLGEFALRAPARGTPPRDDELARSTYAMYNGGPSHRDRWTKPGTRASLRAIDTAFYVKFRAIRDGDQQGVALCYAS